MSNLTNEQIQQIVTEGWCLVKAHQAQSEMAARRALRTINQWCADVPMPSRSGGMNCYSLRDFSEGSFCSDIRTSPPFLDLVEKTAIRDIVHSMIGDTHELFPQIALRFPDNESMSQNNGWHVDGFRRANEIDSFNLLAGFYLSGVSDQDCGNFTVWPGSHAKLARLFSLPPVSRYLATHQIAEVVGLMRQLDLGEPKQVLADAGDVVLCHSLLCHGPNINTSEHIRYMVFMRFRSLTLKKGDTSELFDLWRHWSRDFLNRIPRHHGPP